MTVKAAYSKRRRDDRQPIRADLGERLAAWLADKPKHRPVFAAMPEKQARMLRADLRRAKARWIREASEGATRRERRSSDFLAVEDSEGRVVDFHALRATYITALVKGGASMKVAQELARHSDPKLTMNVYTRLGIHDLSGAIDALAGDPTDGPNETEAMKATGTDEYRADDVSNRRSNRDAERRDEAQADAAGEGLRLAGGDDVSVEDSGLKRDGTRGDAARGGNASRRTRTFNPLIKSRPRNSGLLSIDRERGKLRESPFFAPRFQSPGSPSRAIDRRGHPRPCVFRSSLES